MQGKFAAMSEICKYIPFRSKAVRLGQIQLVATGNIFLLMEYLDLGMDMVDPDEFKFRVAKLHQTRDSPNAMFGFPIAIYHGRSPQNTGWQPSWSVFFGRVIGQFFDREFSMK